MNDCRVLLRRSSTVPGGDSKRVVRFRVVGEKRRRSDVTAFTVNLKVSTIVVLKIG